MSTKKSQTKLRVIKIRQRTSTGHMIYVAYYQLYLKCENWTLGLNPPITSVVLPCSSNLNKFLNGLLHNFIWDFEGDIDVTEEQAKYLKTIFYNEDNSCWTTGLGILRKKGKEAAWQWIRKKIPVLMLKYKLEY